MGLAAARHRVWQTGERAGNVLLGWPLVAAVAHTGGAAALVVVLTLLIVRARGRDAVPQWPGRGTAPPARKTQALVLPRAFAAPP